MIEVRAEAKVPPDEILRPSDHPEWDRPHRERLQRLIRHLLSRPDALREYLRAEALCAAASALQDAMSPDSVDVLERISAEMPNQDDVSFYERATAEGVFAEQVQHLFLDDEAEVIKVSVNEIAATGDQTASRTAMNARKRERRARRGR